MPPYGYHERPSVLLDIFATLITCGLWLIWVVIRQATRGN